MEGESISGATQEPPKTPESVNPKREEIFTKFIKEGVVKKNPTYGPGNYFGNKPYIIDMPKVKLYVKEVEEAEPPPLFEFSEEKIKQESESAFKKTVKSFAEAGTISTDIAVQVGRIVKPGDVTTPNADYARFLHIGNSFPKTHEERGTIEVGTAMVNGWASREMKEILDKNGVHLNQEQLLQLVLRRTISHEYGHAADRVVLLSRTTNNDGSNMNEDDWEIVAKEREKMEKSVYEYIGLNLKLKEIFSGQPEDKEYSKREATTSERIATGFEYIGLRLALLEMGLTEPTVDNIMKGFTDLDQEKIKTFQEMVETAKSHDLTIDDLGAARIQIYGELKDEGEEKQIAAITRPSARVLGYYFPLAQNEIKGYIDSWYIPPKSA